MYLRLAFSVAAHLEPEIMLVDEVLAVGDAAFQRKCLDKMEEVGKQGRTVLFVSHNMPAVARLCERTILLDEGGVVADGPSHEVVSAYCRSGIGTTARPGVDGPRERAGERGGAASRRARVGRSRGAIVEAVDIRQPVGIEMDYEVLAGGMDSLSRLRAFQRRGTSASSATIDSDPEWRRQAADRRALHRARPGSPAISSPRGRRIVNAEISTFIPKTLHCP